MNWEIWSVWCGAIACLELFRSGSQEAKRPLRSLIKAHPPEGFRAELSDFGTMVKRFRGQVMIIYRESSSIRSFRKVERLLFRLAIIAGQRVRTGSRVEKRSPTDRLDRQILWSFQRLNWISVM